MTNKQENHLDALNKKHQALNEQIELMERLPGQDQADIQHLKKEKLAVKDEITAFKRKLAEEAMSPKES